MGNFAHAYFGITHRCSVITIDRAKVALAIYEGVPQGKRLRHSYDCVVNRRVAVGMVFTNHVTDYTRRLFIRFVPIVVEFVHGE